MRFHTFAELPQVFMRGVVQMFRRAGRPVDLALIYDNARLATLEPQDEIPGESHRNLHTNLMTMQEYLGFGIRAYELANINFSLRGPCPYNESCEYYCPICSGRHKCLICWENQHPERRMPNPLEGRGCPWGFTDTRTRKIHIRPENFSVDDVAVMAVYAHFEATDYLADIPQRNIEAWITSPDFRLLVEQRLRDRRFASNNDNNHNNNNGFLSSGMIRSLSNINRNASTTNNRTQSSTTNSNTTNSTLIPNIMIPNTMIPNTMIPHVMTPNTTIPSTTMRRAMTPSTTNQQKGKRNVVAWSEEDGTLVEALMREVLANNSKQGKTEERWKVISDQLLQRWGVFRSWASIKNYWNRIGREKSGVDERRKAKPDRMTTGVQDPASRAAARREKNEKRKKPNDTDDEEDDKQKKRQRGLGQAESIAQEQELATSTAQERQHDPANTPSHEQVQEPAMLPALSNDELHTANHAPEPETSSEQGLSEKRKGKQRAVDQPSDEDNDLDALAAREDRSSPAGGGLEANKEDQKDDEALRRGIAQSLQTPRVGESSAPAQPSVFQNTGGALSSRKNHKSSAPAAFDGGNGRHAGGGGAEADVDDSEEDEKMQRALALSLQVEGQHHGTAAAPGSLAPGASATGTSATGTSATGTSATGNASYFMAGALSTDETHDFAAIAAFHDAAGDDCIYDEHEVTGTETEEEPVGQASEGYGKDETLRQAIALSLQPEKDTVEVGTEEGAVEALDEDERLQQAIALSLQPEQAETEEEEARSSPAAPTREPGAAASAQRKRKHSEEADTGDNDKGGADNPHPEKRQRT